MKRFKNLSNQQWLFGCLLCLLLFTFTGAKRATGRKPRLLPLTSIHIIDRNGFSETIGSKERLNQFQRVDFLSPQPYQKVLRIYGRNSKGGVRSVVTTYHENGNVRQFLEILNARAYGNYYEWHENGTASLMTTVIGGIADVTSQAEKTWVFDGPSYAWDEDGHLLAEINYDQGILEGVAIYYHSSGEVWKRIPYAKNQVDGNIEIYKKEGDLLKQISYVQGQRQGVTRRYWDCEHLASQEEYNQGKLYSGQYFDKQNNLLSEVVEGTGYRLIFGKNEIKECQEYQNGTLEGKVQVFNAYGHLKRIYHVKNGIKHGEEIEYYDAIFKPDESAQPKLSFYWYEGKIQGYVKTWYPKGQLESHKEMANNAKNGLSTAWYREGDLMMIEEYENDKLLRGEYFRKGERIPISQINQGKGTATLFDADGHFVRKVVYVNSKPEL